VADGRHLENDKSAISPERFDQSWLMRRPVRVKSTVHRVAKVELYATLSTLPISPNKTAKNIKQKLTLVSLHCKSRRSKTANIKILSANSKHKR